jgi:hypothetical protein
MCRGEDGISVNRNDLLRVLDERIRIVALEVFSELQQQSPPPDICVEAKELQKKLQRILAKEFISISEAALLLGCSDGHLRNLISKAAKGKTATPIPYLDLDGVTVLPRAQLLDWAAWPKAKMCTTA